MTLRCRASDARDSESFDRCAECERSRDAPEYGTKACADMARLAG